MRMRILFLFLLVGLLAPTKASAQGCVGVMQPQYSSYFSYSYDETYIHTVNEVDGSTIIRPSPYCPIGNATHRGSSTNILNGVGGQVWGPPTAPAGYISVVNPQQIIGVPGIVYLDSTSAQIICTKIGSIFASGGGLFHIEVAFTRFITGAYTVVNDGGVLHRYYTISPFCTPATTPPDWTGAGLYWIVEQPPTRPTQVVDGKTICLRVGTSGPWYCVPAGKFTGGSYWIGTIGLGDCTHNP